MGTARRARLLTAVLLAVTAIGACGDGAPQPALTGEPRQPTTTAASAETTDPGGSTGTTEADGLQTTTTPPSGDLLQTVQTAGSFQQLMTAIETAGLAETLGQPGPFTLFAPDDAAFAALPPGTLDQLLADPARLREVLSYHVVPGLVQAADLRHGEQLQTVQGDPLPVTIEGSTVRVGQATVTRPDLPASNGVIHVVDAVLMPPGA